MKRLICFCGLFLIGFLVACNAEETNNQEYLNTETTLNSTAEAVNNQTEETIICSTSADTEVTDLKDATNPIEQVVTENIVTTSKETFEEITTAPQDSENSAEETTEEMTTHPWEDPNFEYPPNMTPIG